MKNFLKKGVKVVGTKKWTVPLLIMIPVIIFSVFVYNARAQAISGALITSPSIGSMWNGIINITWDSSLCDMGEIIDIAYSKDSFDAKSTLVSNVTCADGEYSWDTTGLLDSDSYQIRIYRNQAGSSYETSDIFTIDNTDPELTVGTGANDGVDAGPVKTDSILLNASDEIVGLSATKYAFSDDANCDSSDFASEVFDFTSGTAFDVTGDHTDYLCAMASDLAGNETYLLVGQLNTDNTNPEITVTPLNEAIVNGNFDLKITTTDLNSTITRFIISPTESYILPVTEPELTQLAASANWINTITYNDNTWTADIISTELDNGSNSFSVKSIDTAGNIKNTGIITYIVDNKKPETTFSTIPNFPDGNNGWYVTAPSITLDCSDADDSADATSGCNEIYYRWGSTGDFLEYDNPITAPEGESDLYYYSVDVAGNVEDTNGPIHFKVDTGKPIIEAGGDIIKNIGFTTSATTEDENSGLNTYSWTGPEEITFGTPGALNTTVSASTDGVYTITLTVTDVAGNSSTDSFNYTFDTVLPDFTIVEGVETGPVMSDDIEIDITDDVLEVITGEYGFSSDGVCDGLDTYGNNFSDNVPFTITGDNTQLLCIKIADVAGNVAYGEVGTLNIDNTAPTLNSVNIVSSNTTPNLAKVGDIITLTFEANENIRTPEVLIAGKTASVAETSSYSDKQHWTATYQLQTGDSEEGLITFSISFKDIAGNIAVDVVNTTDSSKVFFDSVAPIELVLSNTPDLFASGTSLGITVSGTDVVAYKYNLDGAGYSSESLVSAEITASGLSEGDHTISVLGRDKVGNWMTSPEVYDWTIDLTPPNFTISNPKTDQLYIGGGVMNIEWDDTDINKDMVDILYSTNGTNWEDITTGEADTGLYSWTLPTITSDSVTVKVIATDKAGNTGEGVSGTFKIDYSPATPTITVNTDPIYDGSLVQTVTVSYDEVMRETPLPVITLSASEETPTTTGGSWTNNQTFTQVFTYTDEGEEAIITASVTGGEDLAGNVANDDSVSFNIDTLNPTATVSVAPATIFDGALTLTVTTTYSEKMDNTVDPEFEFTRATFTSKGDGSWDGSKTIWTESFSTTDLGIEDGDTVLVKSAQDIAGNVQVNSIPEAFEIDTLNPVISNVVITGNNALNPTTRAKVGDVITTTFITSEPVTTPMVTIVGFEATDITNPSGDQETWIANYTLLNTDAEGAINYTINALDLAGNEATTVSGATAIIFDRTGADITTDNIISKNANNKLAKVGDEITLTFSTNEDVIVDSVKIGGGDASVTGGPTAWIAKYTMTDSSADGFITYEINTTDLAGNTSSKLETSDVRFDKIIPELLKVSIASSNSNSSSLAKVGDTVTLTFTASEAILGKPVVTIDGEEATVSEISPNFTATLLLDDDNTSGEISFTINFNDLAGNNGIEVVSTTDSTAVSFDKNAPSFTNLAPGVAEQTSDTTPLIGVDFLEEGSGINLSTATLHVDGFDVTVFATIDANGIHYQPTAPLTDGIHIARVNVTDNAGNQAGQLEWLFEVAATAKGLNVTSDKATVFADGTSQAKITAQVLDAGTPVSGGSVTFSSSIGTITNSPVTVDSNGKAVTYISSDEIGNAVITASYNFSGDVRTNTVNVNFTETIKTLSVTVTPGSIVADGTETANINATVYSNGVAMTGELVNFVTDLGTLSGTTDTSSILSSVTAGTATITATYNTGSGIITDTATVVVTEVPVVDTTSPSATTNPVDDATLVPISINPVITFSELMDETSLAGKIELRNYSDNSEIPATLQIESMSGVTAVTIVPDTELAKEVQYYFFLGSGIKDLAGNEMETWYQSDRDDHEFTTKGDVTTFDISLNAGWNLISLPLVPNDTAIESVLAGLTGDDLSNVDMVRYYDASTGTWLSYKEGVSSTLSTMEDGKGYWINMIGTDTLNINGVETETGVSIPKSYHVEANSWNLVGFKSAYTQKANEYISQIGTDDVIWKYDLGYSSIYNNTNHEGLMESGYGYWLYNHGFGYDIIPVN